jgi:hypothetical protein
VPWGCTGDMLKGLRLGNGARPTEPVGGQLEGSARVCRGLAGKDSCESPKLKRTVEGGSSKAGTLPSTSSPCESCTSSS